MTFTSAPIPYQGPISREVAQERAERLAKAQAERFGYRAEGVTRFRVDGDDRGGQVVAVIDTVEVRRVW